MDKFNINLNEFLNTGFYLKDHLSDYLDLSRANLDSELKDGLKNMASFHPVSFQTEEVTSFYESKVGTAHLLELAAWHLGSADYIADTIRLQQMFAHGKVLDFGGGIGTHAIAASALPSVEHVYFVDLNPHNREFVSYRANHLGLNERISVHRDLSSTGEVLFDTITCLDVLEHLPDPAEQLLLFLNRLSANSIALMNWYFYKGNNGEYPFHIDDKKIVKNFFLTLQKNFIEQFHPFLITTRAYRPMKSN
ncbi:MULTISPECIES: class I SAM-dependent methyltransferase [Prochlorococcus]|uniref:class I SAM-dependent methyltransferase n=1 Tax=Prochlorococcus TaxID=1218 RepID=UPI000533870C|nr:MULTISPECIES: methyltransferase domain-containing protein [Prochlorococcus]KGG11927.1 SAM-dependent methyltransferase [Prochlorococcus sp. MIT 0601]